MLTVIGVLLAIAFGFTICHAVRSPFPLWPAVLVLCLIELIQVLPLGK